MSSLWIWKFQCPIALLNSWSMPTKLVPLLEQSRHVALWWRGMCANVLNLFNFKFLPMCRCIQTGRHTHTFSLQSCSAESNSTGMRLHQRPSCSPTWRDTREYWSQQVFWEQSGVSSTDNFEFSSWRNSENTDTLQILDFYDPLLCSTCSITGH